MPLPQILAPFRRRDDARVAEVAREGASAGEAGGVVVGDDCDGTAPVTARWRREERLDERRAGGAGAAADGWEAERKRRRRTSIEQMNAFLSYRTKLEASGWKFESVLGGMYE